MNTNTSPFFLILFLVFYFASYAQEPIYQHFGVDEGLPSSEVYDVFQDKQGYIWFATDKGLSRYNGYEFENFDTSDGLPGNVVLRFYPQENGEVWCYNYHKKALFYFNQDFNGFTKYKYNSALNKELISSSIIKSVFVDKFNTIHIGGVHINGEIVIDSNGTVNRNYTSKDFFDLENIPEKYFVLNEYSKTQNSFFITSDLDKTKSPFIKRRGLYTNGTHLEASWLIPNKKAIFMENNFIELKNYDNRTIHIKSDYRALGIKVIDSTHFFVGYLYGGGKIMNDKGDVIKAYLKEKSVTKFLIDHEGGYWFTTVNSGVYYIKNPQIAVFNHPDYLQSPHINSLVKKNKDLLVGYKNGGYAKIGSNTVFKFENTNSVSSPTIVEYDSVMDRTYIAYNHKVKIDEKFTLKGYMIKISEPTKNGTVFSTAPLTFYSLNTNAIFRFPYRILDVCLWKKDTLIATPKGIFKKHADSLLALTSTSKLLSHRSDDIDSSPKGNCLYIATQGAGIVVFGKKIFNITKKEGLTSNIINEIHIENDSTIWACTNKGLNRVVFTNNNFSITKIDKNDGLLSNEVEDVEIINDTLWVGTKQGLCYMPKKVLDNNPLKNVYLKIKKVNTNTVDHTKDKQLRLKYNENKITFIVEGISYSRNNDLEYQYRLKEIDSKWSSTKSRTISFPNLKQGQYTFQVRACLAGASNSKKQLEYNFVILPPFWKSWWFYSLSFLVLSGLVYLFFKIRVLTYNKDVIRELIRLLIKWLKGDEKFLEIRMNGEDIRIATMDILYVKSSGNYLDIITNSKTYTFRCKIGDFIDYTPDALEYLRIHRSYIIRIDKVTGKSKRAVTIKEHTIPVGETYVIELDKIHF